MIIINVKGAMIRIYVNGALAVHKSQQKTVALGQYGGTELRRTYQ